MITLITFRAANRYANGTVSRSYMTVSKTLTLHFSFELSDYVGLDTLKVRAVLLSNLRIELRAALLALQHIADGWRASRVPTGEVRKSFIVKASSHPTLTIPSAP